MAEGRRRGKDGKRKVERSDGRAMGIDRITNEVWKYGGEELKDWEWQVCSRI